MKDVIKYSKRSGTGIFNAVERKDFICLELNIPCGGEWMKNVFSIAKKIVPGLNGGQANTSEKRAFNIVQIDNLSGLIAEYACREILNWRYGKGKILKPANDSSFDQIDLKLYNGKSIEVRSSCVRNGIDFAIFARNKNAAGEQYFDVIGPYTNGYKKGESLKDYYMRALYECDKRDFMELLTEPALKLFLTGGATKEMMGDPGRYQIKHLTPAGGQVRIESDYRVVPLAKSLDINEFFRVLERENEGLVTVRQ